MISLTYLSRATSPLSAEQLQKVLDVSRTRNLAAGVTGMLLYTNEKFIQTLEGEPEDVEATMARILLDSRHRDLDVTLQEDITERSFPDWSMGFRVTGREDIAALDGFSDFLDPRGQMYEHSKRLGRAGVFLRVFRDIHPGEADHR